MKNNSDFYWDSSDDDEETADGISDEAIGDRRRRGKQRAVTAVPARGQGCRGGLEGAQEHMCFLFCRVSYFDIYSNSSRRSSIPGLT